MKPENTKQMGAVTISRNGYVQELECKNEKLRSAAQHCYLFLTKQKGNRVSEQEERKSIIRELNDVLRST